MRSCPYPIALAALAAIASSASASLGLNAYEVDGSDPGAARTLAEAGFDVHEGGGGEAIEIIASRSQVAGLRKQGLDPELKVVDGVTGSAVAVQDVNEDSSYDIYRPYFNEAASTTCYVGQEAASPGRRCTRRCSSWPPTTRRSSSPLRSADDQLRALSSPCG